ncbi:hypothetical protein AB0K48_01875 [Nonomuraea sp. NPDC055795]
MDKRVLDWMTLVGVFFEIAGLMCATDWLRTRARPVVGAAGKVVYVAALSYLGGLSNNWLYGMFGAGRLVVLGPEVLPWVMGIIGGFVVSLFLLFGSDRDRMSLAGGYLSLVLIRFVIGVPGVMLLLWVVQLFADCSTWPDWLRLGTYDCSPLEWLRYRAAYVAVMIVFWAAAVVGAIAVMRSGRSRDAAVAPATESAGAAMGLGLFLIVLGTMLSSALESILNLAGVTIK